MMRTNPQPLRRTGLSKFARFLFYASPTMKQLVLAVRQIMGSSKRTFSYSLLENSETSVDLICITNGFVGLVPVHLCINQYSALEVVLN